MQAQCSSLGEEPLRLAANDCHGPRSGQSTALPGPWLGPSFETAVPAIPCSPDHSPFFSLNKWISVVSGEQILRNFLSMKAHCRRTAQPSQGLLCSMQDPEAPSLSPKRGQGGLSSSSTRPAQGTSIPPPGHEPTKGAEGRDLATPLLSLPKGTAELRVGYPAARGRSEGASDGKKTPQNWPVKGSRLSAHTPLPCSWGHALPHTKPAYYNPAAPCSKPGGPSVTKSFSSGEIRGGLHPCVPEGRHLFLCHRISHY